MEQLIKGEKMNKSDKDTISMIKSDELSEEDLELVIGGIMSEIVIRETMENIKRLVDKKDHNDHPIIQ